MDYVIKNLKDLKLAFKNHKPTPIERVMASCLLTEGYNFIYQFKLNLPDGLDERKYLIIDFVLFDINVAIEVDGKCHITEENWIKDRNKLNILSATGFSVLRFGWDDVMNAEGVLFFLNTIKSSRNGGKNENSNNTH
jgi:very-short-patch-repair endonuclease